MSRSAWLVAVSVFLVLLLPVAVPAQTPNAALTGMVRTSEGKVLEGAAVTARDVERGYEYQTVSASTGRYWLAGLPPGRYEVTAKRMDYQAEKRSGVRLAVGQTVAMDFMLGTAPVEMPAIEVKAAPPLIETTQSDVAYVMDEQTIEAIPQESRHFMDLAKLAPGATQGFDVAGVDRLSQGTPFVGGLNAQSIGVTVDGADDILAYVHDVNGGVPLLAVDQFEVVTTRYAPEYGKAASGVVNLVTRRGGNKWTGEAFGLVRDQALNALGTFEQTKPDYGRQHFGLALGGPIVRDRTHVFVAGEYRNEDRYATVETNGVFPDKEGTFETPFEETYLFGRVNHQAGENHELSLRYLGHMADAIIGVGPAPGAMSGTSTVYAYERGGDMGRWSHSVLLSDRWRLGATTTNELLLHGTAFSLTYDRLASGPALDYPTLAMGATYTAQHNREMRFQLRDNLSTLLSGRSGTHLAKCGLDVSWIQARFDGDFCKNGYFIFETDTSSLPVGGYVGFAPSHNVIPDWQFGLYAQDDWNPSSHLTLSLGLRYDLETNGANNGYRSPYADVLPFTSSDPRPIDWDNLGPRLGFAWDLQRDGRTVIRGGFGVFYDAYITQFESMEAQPTPYTWVSDPGTTDISQIPVNPDSILPGVIALAPTMETPMTRQYSLGMEHAFPGDWVVRADGIFIQGRNLPMQRSLNTYEFVDESTIVWRYPDFDLVTQVLNRGEAETKMLILQLRKSFPQARIDLSYTLADRQATEDLIWSDYSPQVDPSSEDFSSDMGPVAWDERHRVVLAGQLRLPFGLNVGLAGIYASARPYNVVTGNDDNHDNVWNNDRPPGVGRNSERGPDYLNVDLSLKQVFRTSRGEVGLVANVYNLFNRTNYDARSVVINQQAASFGEPLGAYPKRQVEVGVELKY